MKEKFKQLVQCFQLILSIGHSVDTLNSNLERSPLQEITGLVQNHELCDQKRKGNSQKQNFQKQSDNPIKPGISAVTQGKMQKQGVSESQLTYPIKIQQGFNLV